MKPLYLDHAIIIACGKEMRGRVHDAVDRCTGRMQTGFTDAPRGLCAVGLTRVLPGVSLTGLQCLCQ
jgi:hypothetical protein